MKLKCVVCARRKYYRWKRAKTRLRRLYHWTLQSLCQWYYPITSRFNKKNGGFCRCIYRLYSGYVEKHQLQAVQLRKGDGDWRYIATIQGRSNQTFSIKDHFDFSLLTPYEQAVDFSRARAALPEDSYGFDWTILNAIPCRKCFLSGELAQQMSKKLSNY